MLKIERQKMRLGIKPKRS